MKHIQFIRNCKRSKAALLLISALSISGIAFAGKAENTGGELTVHFDDVQGMFDPRVEWVREDLLETAFYDAARRAKLPDNYTMQYNATLPKKPKNTLDFRIIEWRRSHANFYEFRAFATYYDADGNAVKLGPVSGTRSGISVMTRYDVGDTYIDAAEDAFRQALRKIEGRAS